jgi:hypothetical protein
VSPAQAANYTDNNHWMADLAATIGQRPLKQVVIPGSHDTGTYALKGAFWTYGGTHWDTMNITNQLNHGMRWFDLRAKYEDLGSTGADYFMFHGAAISDLRLETVLSEIHDWVIDSGHEKEIVMLKIYTEGFNQEAFDDVCGQFKTNFNSLLITPSMRFANYDGINATLNDIWAAAGNPRVITDWSACTNPEAWPSDTSFDYIPPVGASPSSMPFDSYYANQCYTGAYDGVYAQNPGIVASLESALKLRANTIEHGPNFPTTPGSQVNGIYTLYVQATLTFDCFVPLYGLTSRAQAGTVPAVKGWYDNNQHNARKNLNVIAGDFVEETSLVANALGMNEGPTLTVSAKTADDQPYSSGQATTQPVTLDYTCAGSDNAPAGSWFPKSISVESSGTLASHTLNPPAKSFHSSVTIAPDDLANNQAFVQIQCTNVSERVSRVAFQVNFQRPPTVTPQITPANPNGQNGWYSSGSIIINWTVKDNGSETTKDGCDSATITTDQAATLTCSATNAYGTTQQSVTIKRDTTMPTLSFNTTNADGTSYVPDSWTNQAVTVDLICDDATSGVADCPADTIVSAEGANLYATGAATDNAGNSSPEGSVGPIKIDTTKPTITGQAAPAPNAKGWNNTDVTVTFTCDDSLSKIATCSPQKVLSADGAAQSATGTALDNAGNSGTTTVSSINIDKTAPTISAGAKKADGTTYTAGTWANQSVTVQFTCADVTSKVASCSPNQTFSSDGVTDNVEGTAQDNADNSATISFGPVKVDKTRPTVTYSGNAGTYTPDQTINITCTAADSLSGVASSTCKNISGPAYSFAVGTNSFSAQATDNAGNLGAGTTSFILKVTSASLSTVINQLVTDAGVAQSLIVKANEIAAAPNAGAKANKLQAFISLVQAQTGKSITQAQADILIKLSRGL